ncbi:MAG: porin family protein [Alistipes sp.]|nr:porin family protein [Alistipes sp.]
MKKTYLFLTLCLCGLSSIPVSAQWSVGVSGGYTYNKLTTSSDYKYDLRYKARGGWSIAVPVQYRFFDWLAVQAELSYLQKNYHQYRGASHFSSIYCNVRNSYLQIPLMAQFSFGSERVRGFLNAGGYMGFWLRSRAQGVGLSWDITHEMEDNKPYSSNVEFDSRRDRRVELGALVGLGVQYNLSPQIHLQAEARYLYALTDMQKNNMLFQFPRYNNTFVTQIGIPYTFLKK